ncbi:heme exporter protein CcmB [candidate division WOR-3 bacterium]|nr:heme exporter protein CcmB [candidate division WOR-3 bacterium]
MKPFRDLFILVKKDILEELKTGGALISMLIFSLLIIFIFGLTLESFLSTERELAAVLLWVTIIFVSTLGLNYSFSVEKENSSIKGIMLTPADRGVIYLGKMFSNLIFIFIVEMFTVPLFLMFYNYSLIKIIPPLSIILVLGTAGIASVGTILSAISTCTKKRDILLPIILFPIIVPVLIGSIRCTEIIFLKMSLLAEAGKWISMLVAYDILFIVVSFLIFEFVLEEL